MAAAPSGRAAGAADTDSTSAETERSGPASAWRGAVVHIVVAAVATAVLYEIVVAEARTGHTGAETVMSSMRMGNISTHRAFYWMQATGLAALIWAYLGLAIGLTLGSPRLAARTRRQGLERLHRQLNMVVLALILAHALISVPGTTTGTWLATFVPQQAVFKPIAYTTGIIGLYLAILLGPTYYLRRFLGRRVWLITHQFAALTYVLGLWHTLLLGADFRVHGTVRTACWVLQIPLLALFALRLASLRRRHTTSAQPRVPLRRRGRLRLAVAAGVLTATAGTAAVMIDAITHGLPS